jgi:hypothetical protein
MSQAPRTRQWVGRNERSQLPATRFLRRGRIYWRKNREELLEKVRIELVAFRRSPDVRFWPRAVN